MEFQEPALTLSCSAFVSCKPAAGWVSPNPKVQKAGAFTIWHRSLPKPRKDRNCRTSARGWDWLGLVGTSWDWLGLSTLPGFGSSQQSLALSFTALAACIGKPSLLANPRAMYYPMCSLLGTLWQFDRWRHFGSPSAACRTCFGGDSILIAHCSQRSSQPPNQGANLWCYMVKVYESAVP